VYCITLIEEEIIEQGLDDWRRTHYSSQISSSDLNRIITVMGWISSKRDHGNVLFLQLRDQFGDTQIVTKKKKDNENRIFETLKVLKEHSSIAIRGKVVDQKKTANSFEVIPEEIRVLSISSKAAPFLTQAISSIGIDTRLELRALDLRRNYLQNVFKIRFTILNSIRQFLSDRHFIEVNTPKMIATATEGGAALFPIFYYDREAFLAQSPQLYKEQLTMAFENVFEIAPIFRAEPSRTNRHLSEAISIDVEKAFVDYSDIMKLIDELIFYIVTKVKEQNYNELKSMDIQLPEISIPFPRYTYSELVDKLQESHKYIRWGDDISPKILKDIVVDNFYFITDWPMAAKPFYVKPKSTSKAAPSMVYPSIAKSTPNSAGNPAENSGGGGVNSEDGADNYGKKKTLSESFDLMFGPLEISSGSTRLSNKTHLLENMKNKGLNSSAFDYHLRVFDYGVPPHAGFGLGLERLIMALLKLENIRDATFYPRDIDRLTP
jgi:nondiscriminating aspartyl-tRNA synthetase